MKNLFLVVGRSSSGKDSIIGEVCKQLNKTKLISYTTRPKRKGEENTHIFIKPEDVKEYKKDIIAYTKIGEYEYFATLPQLYESDFYIIDPKGIKYLQKKIKKEDLKLVIIYITLTDNERMIRAMKRGDNLKTYLKRSKNEQKQFEQFDKKLNKLSDVCVVNNKDFNVSVEKVIQIVNFYKNLKTIKKDFVLTKIQ